ncbi:MAG: hypothetical protein NWF01_03655 [Candidatus Bathyarchaeota archaeon]|nr:hypothetical protein [Candidatus Bathyarchaeota archaeon]
MIASSVALIALCASTLTASLAYYAMQYRKLRNNHAVIKHHSYHRSI